MEKALIPELFVTHETLYSGVCLTIFKLGPKHVGFCFRACRFTFLVI